MKIGIALLIIAVIMSILILVFSFGMVQFITKPQKWSLEEFKKRISDEGVSFEWFLKSRREVLNVYSDYGYELHGFLMKQEEPTDQYVILTHGYTSNRWESLAYANIYYELGYHVYLYDMRYHGDNEDNKDNESSFCSMGCYEHMDILAIAEELRRRFGEEIRIGLHGVSLGASSSILALRLYQGFSFCVSDCGFADLKELMAYLSGKWFHLPKIMVYPVNWACCCRYHFDLLKIKPWEALQRNTVTPLLFIHGTADDFILPSHAKRLYETASSYKELHYIEGAEHARSIYQSPEEYRRIVTEFLKRVCPDGTERSRQIEI